MTLDPIQLRVLGALVEKEIATPENYPLSLNALVNACNQRSSRDPVLNLAEDEVRQAIHSLEDLKLTAPVNDSRVPKYEHRIRTVLNLRRDETAVLCLLMLRGAQTPGELRSRADRLYTFDDIGSVTSTLDRLASRPQPAQDAETPDATGPLVIMLPRQPGARESRYMHLLGGPIAVSAPPSSWSQPLPDSGHSTGSSRELLVSLHEEVITLHSTVAALERRITQLESLRTSEPLPLAEAVD
ncbi:MULTISPECIES: YceH family protein [Acidobacteriaceae]|uniref:YceH family protein n=1 Tax=Acidobacteriaceae TaxID=204434 RepID=UPI00131CCD05|nr:MULTISPECIES: YceH family protein [Acidobacteriaceae]MDW5264838.1 YceH family protein [Edaphobacter sp.]